MRRRIFTAALASASTFATATYAQDTGGTDSIDQAAPVLSQRPPQTAPNPANPIIVLGSRIPRVLDEGPAPVTTITSEDILRQGYQDVPALLASITQNNGSTQSPQSYGANTFTPGAQQVDLRGLGPNHTLVLVNGRRVADFPMPYGGNSNVADISNIPIGLIKRVEILSGAASAIYGSDAISGVVNFELDRDPDGTRIDAQAGLNDRGGGESYRLTATTGFKTDNLYAVFGAEYRKQEPLWGFERGYQDSTADNPTTASPVALRNFLRTDEYYSYIDPGASTCQSLSGLNQGTTYHASRPGYGWDVAAGEYVDGRYCGSNEAVGYGTIVSERNQLNLYGLPAISSTSIALRASVPSIRSSGRLPSRAMSNARQNNARLWGYPKRSCAIPAASKMLTISSANWMKPSHF